MSLNSKYWHTKVKLLQVDSVSWELCKTMNWNRLIIVVYLIVLINVVNSKDLDWCSTATTSCGASHVACNNDEVTILLIIQN